MDEDRKDDIEKKDEAVSVDDLNEALAGVPPDDGGATVASPDDTPERCAEYRAGWQRAMADYANLKREAERQRSDLSRYACADLVAQLLPVIEALRKSSVHEPKPAEGSEHPPDIAQWIGGIRAIRQQLDSVLAKVGVEMIDGVGVAFDPNIHEAVMTRAVEGSGSGQVVEVLEAGCRVYDRVIRPARVVVGE
ncbi:nucleotide exchange factor GrpE [Candidatus Uhrbacteria bacterium]|nr:nucleotide exchange factor GrpE [Candidatus Uhrbacteria bacterium]